jgi:hypothetical protein
MIKPTVGRVVLYTPPANDPILLEYQAPFKADVIYVWGDRCVNLSITYPNGQVRFESSVTLVQEGDRHMVEFGRYAEWMPYQIGQAAKHTPAAPVDVPTFLKSIG